MGETTEISWTNSTFNLAWGCQKVSEGCQNCYAEAFAKRTGHDVWGPTSDRRMLSDKNWSEPLKWNRAAERASVRHRVFCSSMADVFEDHAQLVAPRLRLWSLIEATPWLDWQLLTKRPQNMRAMLPPAWLEKPRANVWLGCTAENQNRAIERLPVLLSVPAAQHFVSAEPLLGPVNLMPWLRERRWTTEELLAGNDERLERGAVSWVIVGSESGPGARAMDVAWARKIVDDCRAAGVRVFTKQIATEEGRAAGDRKGGDPAYWPPGVWPREFPEVRS